MKCFYKFDLRQPDVPDKVSWGFLELDSIEPVRGKIVELVISATGPNQSGVSLICFNPDGSLHWLIYIQMFRLPGGQAQLKENTEFFRKQEAGFRLQAGRKFGPDVLATPAVPSAWQHDAFQIKRQGIVHVHQGRRHGLLIRYLYEKPREILDFPIFQWFNDNLRLKENAWCLKKPQISKAVKSKSLKPVATEKRLSAIVRKEITGAITRATANLKLPSKDVSPAAAQQAIYDAINAVLRSKKKPGPKIMEGLAIELGCLWGQTLCDELGWQWCVVQSKTGKLFAVASKNRSHAVAPMQFIKHQLGKRGANADNTSLLLFNMIKAGKVSPATARQYQILS